MNEPEPSPEELPASRIDLNALRTAADRLRDEIGKVIVGQQQMVEHLLAAVLADGHVLLEGPPGVAKTLTAKLLARTLAVDFARVQFTPDLMPSDVLGTTVYNNQSASFEFRPGPIFTNIVLIDEINRAPAKTQAALFEVMEEKQVTTDGETRHLEAPFVVLATQNPIEQEGTYRLPEAQLDRFLFKIEVPYPTLQEERQILSTTQQRGGQSAVDALEAVLTAEQLATYRTAVRSLHFDENLVGYVAELVHTTRQDPALFLGASPRASLGIMAAAKAVAALAGRDFVTPEDIQEVAPPVLRHRIQLTPEQEMEGTPPDEVIRALLARVEVPR